MISLKNGFKYCLKISLEGPVVLLQGNPLLVALTFHFGADTTPSSPTVDLIPCLWPEKIGEDSDVLGPLDHVCGDPEVVPPFGSFELLPL